MYRGVSKSTLTILCRTHTVGMWRSGSFFYWATIISKVQGQVEGQG